MGMPFRKREAKPEVTVDSAQAEIDRARGALTYWKQQQQASLEELAGMQGVGGWIARLTGQHASYVAEAEKKIQICQQKLLAEKQALANAKEQLEICQGATQQAKQAKDERDLDLEVLAAQVRDDDTPEAAQLRGLEDQLDRVGHELIKHQEVIAAAGALSASMGALNRNAIQAQTGMMGILPVMVGSKIEYDKIPAALNRLNEACLACDIPPMDIRIPGIDVKTVVTDPMYMLTNNKENIIENLRTAILDERDTILQIQLQVANLRKQTLEEQQQLHEARRALLEAIEAH